MADNHPKNNTTTKVTTESFRALIGLVTREQRHIHLHTTDINYLIYRVFDMDTVVSIIDICTRLFAIMTTWKFHQYRYDVQHVTPNAHHNIHFNWSLQPYSYIHTSMQPSNETTYTHESGMCFMRYIKFMHDDGTCASISLGDIEYFLLHGCVAATTHELHNQAQQRIRNLTISKRP